MQQKIIVTGANGQLGSELRQILDQLHIALFLPMSTPCDLTSNIDALSFSKMRNRMSLSTALHILPLIKQKRNGKKPNQSMSEFLKYLLNTAPFPDAGSSIYPPIMFLKAIWRDH